MPIVVRLSRAFLPQAKKCRKRVGTGDSRLERQLSARRSEKFRGVSFFCGNPSTGSSLSDYPTRRSAPLPPPADPAEPRPSPGRGFFLVGLQSAKPSSREQRALERANPF